MPEQQQQEVTSFKTRTHHGSGKKETYNLKVSSVSILLEGRFDAPT